VGSLRDLMKNEDKQAFRAYFKLPETPQTSKVRRSISALTWFITTRCVGERIEYKILIKNGAKHLDVIRLLRANLLMNEIASQASHVPEYPHLILYFHRDLTKLDNVWGTDPERYVESKRDTFEVEMQKISAGVEFLDLDS
jgi:hypothetical protein